MKTRILSLFAVAVLAAALLAGCQTREPVQESQIIETEPPATEDPYAGMVEVYDGYGGTMWIAGVEGMTPFSMDRSAFSVSDGVVSYAGEGYTLMRGIDVSEHQGEIDWQAVAADGIEFALIRCGWRGYGGGSLNEDAYFRQNVEGAQAAGLQVGVYFFSQAVSMVEGAEEAIYTLELLDGYDLELPVFFDWEEIGVDTARTDDVDGQTVTAACLEFCRLVESAGYDTGVYAYLNLAYFTYDLAQLTDLTFWMGDPGSFPEFYYEHTYWQYSFTGSVAGIDGDVDLDVIFCQTPGQAAEVSQTEEEAAG